MTFSHIGLYVTDMPCMVRFYTTELRFSVADRATIRYERLLSESTLEHH
jgi:hypothetical protein